MLLKLTNPATGEVFESLEADDPARVADRYARARAAQPMWAATPLADRKAAIARFRALLSEERELLADTLTREMGKPVSQARGEIGATDGRIGFFLDHVDAALASETVHEEPGLVERVDHEPLGVVANISAWNYPWFVGTNVFVPALLAGNAVLYKPSEHATLTGLAMGRLLRAAGVPEDVFQVVVGAGDAGRALLDQPVDGVFFTGSYETGKRVAAAAAHHLAKVQLELGGKDPAYVADDVDVDAVAAAVAEGAFYNTGQSCCAVERVYVHRDVYDAFVERFVAAVKGFRVGDPADPETFIGPLARPAQVRVLTAQVEEAVTKGARILVGGEALEGPGAWFAPTVLVDVTHEMSVMRDESFGPIIGVMAVDSDDAALHMMRDTPYGLTASVYSRSRERAEKILRGLPTGSSYWNCCDRVSPRLPWSGRGSSGLGLTLSVEGIRTFTQPRAWHLRG